MNNLKIVKKSSLFTLVFSVAIFLSTILFFTNKTFASSPTDEILNYTVMVDVLDDASLDIKYNISWKVLESDSAGPLEWVKIGIPNKHCKSYMPISGNISKMSTMNSGGNYIRVDFDRKYYEGEVVDFSFRINQDNVYIYNNENDTATYFFTPGWFDDITVDNLNIMWNDEKIETYIPNAYNNSGYLFWNTALAPGEKQEIKITYSGDAYNFNKELLTSENEDSHAITGFWLFDIIIYMIVIVMMLAVSFMPVLVPCLVVFSIYKSFSGLSMASEKKVTRTLVEYHDSCPNCGGTREEGGEKCEYCGSNMVKNKTVVDETKLRQLKQKDGDILSYNTNGEYKYKGSPNTFLRVNVVSVPRVSRTTSGRSSGHHSSCAHSSCACACACACAGGGRAGCSTKDFYNTNLKLKYIINTKLNN